MSKESDIKIENLEYEDVIEEAKSRLCEKYNSGFLEKKRKAQRNNEPTSKEVYKTLAMVTSFHFNPQNMEEPFDPMMVMEGSRSAIADDLSEDQLDLIENLIEDTDDPELKARLADIIWIRRRDFEKAKIAITAYLDSADHLQDDEIFNAVDRLERALRLSNSLGKGAPDLYDSTIEKIKKIINEIEYEDSFLALRLMDLLLEFNKGDAESYTELTKEIAEKAEGKNDWRRARKAWRNNARWCGKLGDLTSERSALINAAETFAQQAEAATSKMVAASFIQKAIEAHRRVGGQQERTDELHNKLLDTQRGIKDEMGSFSTDIDLTEIVKHARESVEDKELQEALFSLCFLVHPLKVKELRDRTQRLANEHPMQFIVSGSLVDAEGKTVAEYPNMLTGSPEEREEALIAHMHRQAQYDIQINVTGMINPARKQILLEHRLRETDLHDLVRSNPLVPPGREYLFTKGLLDGFKGDFISATNILVTQLEHSMRYVLNNHGVITSGIDDDRRQDDRSLNVTLAVDELEDIFGKDIAFTLRSLLINRFGGNLRNKVAHGLMSYYSYYSVEPIYLWGIILRLICWPGIVNAYKAEEISEKDSESKTGKDEEE